MGALIFSWGLLALAAIDYDHHLLPDQLTLPLLWLGLLVNIHGLFTSLESAVTGAIAGYLSLWSIFWLFKLLTGKEGMGYGDFKLYAMLGAWLGWQKLPLVIFIAATGGAIIGLGSLVCNRHRLAQPLAFGPFLALAGWLTLLWGDKLIAYYWYFFSNLYLCY
jgi:leader peptidase (prepilin peptidase)/N-methyltransferase